MKRYFNLVILALVFCSCETRNTLAVEDLLVSKSRNSYLIIDIGSLQFYIQENEEKEDNEEIHLVYPIMNSQSSNSLTSAEGINFNSLCSLETWLWEGEKMDIAQSKVEYQRALVEKEGDWYLVQCQGNTEVSAFSFRDEMLEWGASSVLKLEYDGVYMGWYRYGGASIEKVLDIDRFPQPDAFLVVK